MRARSILTVTLGLPALVAGLLVGAGWWGSGLPAGQEAVGCASIGRERGVFPGSGLCAPQPLGVERRLVATADPPAPADVPTDQGDWADGWTGSWWARGDWGPGGGWGSVEEWRAGPWGWSG